ncbi:MAG: hypothetical protein KDA84_19895 [Planctomycetaceae bacterium]|nr:hypothetical protein [Planctomycetaceae bacterium]
MNWRAFDATANTVIRASTCILLGVALAAGRVQGVQLNSITFLAAALLCVSGLMFFRSLKVDSDRVASVERWAMWYLVGGMAITVSLVCF